MLKKLLLVLFGKAVKGHEKEIKKAQSWIDSAQAQFANAIQEAELAEKQFEKVETEKRELIDKALEEINELSAKKKQAVDFKNKMKSFIGE
jgi:hypothetical protein